MSNRTIERTRSVKCELTEHERLSAGMEAARCVVKLQALQAARQSSMAEFKGQIEEVQELHRRHSRLVYDGFEHRDVLCDEVHYPETRMVVVCRRDTGEVVEERDMTAEEMQGEFDLGGEADSTQADDGSATSSVFPSDALITQFKSLTKVEPWWRDRDLTEIPCEAELMGAMAHVEGGKLKDNPFPKPGELNEWWARGWRAAREELATEASPESAE